MRDLLVIGSDALAPYVNALRQDGYRVEACPPGCLEAPAGGRYAAVIIELATAAEDSAAKRLLEAAQRGDAPAIIAIIRPGDAAGFDPATGVDDFCVAGCAPVELCARVRQAIWKRHRVDARNVLKCGDLVMDLANYTVHVAGRPVELTYKEYELLRFLATNRGRVITRETLLSKVWGYDFYGGARTVDVHIRRLRSKIEDRHNTFIETVRNVGYRFRAAP